MDSYGPHIVEKTGDQYIRGQNSKIPSNSGQIAKLYLEDKGNIFSMYTKGKMSNCMIELSCIRFPPDPPTKK